MSAASWTAAASVVVALIAALSARASQRAAANAAQKDAQTASRTEIEKEAFERAEGLLDRQFKRQEEEIEGLREDVNRLTKKVRDLEDGREIDKHTISDQAEQIRVLSAVIAARGEA